MMTHWKRAAIYLAILPVIALALIGTYALVRGASNSEESSFPGFRLVRPLFAAEGTKPFPDKEAGLSAYVKFDPSSIDFDKIIKGAFNDMIMAGDNYVIGERTENQALWGGGSAKIRVYADKDGWVVAYITKDMPAANVLTFTGMVTFAGSVASNVKLDTTLNRAIDATAIAISQSTSTDLSWYD